MPRYFFHVHTSEGVTRDQAGQDLPDVERARAEVLRAIEGLDGERAKAAAETSLLIEITDQAGNTVANVALPAGTQSPSEKNPEEDENDLA
jgi:hypothetical protein